LDTALFDTNSVIVSASGNNGNGNSQKNNLIDVTQHFPKSITTDDIHYNSKTVQKLDDVQYNSKTIQKLTVTDKVKSNDRRGPIYTEEAKIQIYAMTGIVSCMLLVILLFATYVMVQKRKDRRSKPIKTPDHGVYLLPEIMSLVSHK
jgi:hypothetical protein